MRLQLLDRRRSPHLAAVVDVWNRACGPDLAISTDLVRYNTQPATGGVQAGWLATEGQEVIGFVLTSALPADPATSSPEVGWLDAVAVVPERQRQGIGTALLDQAERWLAAQGCTQVRLGGSLRPFAPGLPVELDSEPFFLSRGYHARADEDSVWDLAADLATLDLERDKVSRSLSKGMRLAPGRAGDAEALLAFLSREFPGRWRFEFEEFLRAGGRMSEYLLLWRTEPNSRPGVAGFCRTRRRWRYAVEPLDRFFPHRLPQPWGQLGPIGVGTELRGQGLGAALVRYGLARLAACGVRGCVIDWTTLVDFYARFGFLPLRAYRVLVKDLGG